MYCRNCGEEIEDDTDIDDDVEDNSEEEEVKYRDFCSEDCHQKYMAKFLLVAELSQK
jgi:hypothetical protein